MSSESQIAAELYGHRFTNAWILVPFVLSYDHLLTLESEINFVWKRPKRLSFFLFITLRYVSPLNNIGMIALNFGNVPLEKYIFPTNGNFVAP
ncbi:hypothetical protein DFH07DRAFT_974931 [Mycena maculata]|uniref:DUF6533 domain-containing protein n=1 Tax=Mycena maculata TaxID=230809 RepID=A0AAD7H5L0_9AGAR|nr:hypothetical protein DFH07DRAFT_974931 [Mycena maculata]